MPHLGCVEQADEWRDDGSVDLLVGEASDDQGDDGADQVVMPMAGLGVGDMSAGDIERAGARLSHGLQHRDGEAVRASAGAAGRRGSQGSALAASSRSAS